MYLHRLCRLLRVAGRSAHDVSLPLYSRKQDRETELAHAEAGGAPPSGRPIASTATKGWHCKRHCNRDRDHTYRNPSCLGVRASPGPAREILPWRRRRCRWGPEPKRQQLWYQQKAERWLENPHAVLQNAFSSITPFCRHGSEKSGVKLNSGSP